MITEVILHTQDPLALKKDFVESGLGTGILILNSGLDALNFLQSCACETDSVNHMSYVIKTKKGEVLRLKVLENMEHYYRARGLRSRWLGYHMPHLNPNQELLHRSRACLDRYQDSRLVCTK